MKEGEIELLNELVKEGEIKKISVLAPTKEDRGFSMTALSKYELENVLNEESKKIIEEDQRRMSDPEEVEKYKNALRKKLEESYKEED